MRLLIASLVIALGFTGCANIKMPVVKPKKAIDLSAFQGTWYGEAWQPNIRSKWDIKIDIKGNRYNIAYPKLRCGGYLIPVKSTQNQVTFRERITYGRNCINNGFTVLTLTSPNRANFNWYQSNGKAGSYGKIVRK